MKRRKFPVLKDGVKVGEVYENAFKQAVALIGSNVSQGFRIVDGEKRLCFISSEGLRQCS